jgi:hypothetical protein
VPNLGYSYSPISPPLSPSYSRTSPSTTLTDDDQENYYGHFQLETADNQENYYSYSPISPPLSPSYSATSPSTTLTDNQENYYSDFQLETTDNQENYYGHFQLQPTFNPQDSPIIWTSPPPPVNYSQVLESTFTIRKRTLLKSLR